MARILDASMADLTIESDVVSLLRQAALELARLEEFPPRPEETAKLVAAGQAVHLALVELEAIVPRLH